MELAKLFDMQRKLDDHIMDQHQELKGQNNLDWKILALLVELGECANEWRGFKKWSMDQNPRTEVKCHVCNGDGYVQDSPFSVGPCFECLGIGKVKGNPLLEEYVDGLHFDLSIGLELEKEYDWFLEDISQEILTIKSQESLESKDSSITEIFNACFFYASLDPNEWYCYLFAYYLILGEKLGFTWEQIEEAYFSKNAVNHQRQESGY